MKHPRSVYRLQSQIIFKLSTIETGRHLRYIDNRFKNKFYNEKAIKFHEEIDIDNRVSK